MLRFALFFALCCPNIALAYGEDFHYLWTYYLALHVGFTDRQAYQIASAAQAIDNDETTGPLLHVPKSVVLVGSDAESIPPWVSVKWRSLHCFVDHTKEDKYRRLAAGQDVTFSWKESFGYASNTDGLVQTERNRWLAPLKAIAREEGNLGPWLHYTQDCSSHFAFNDIVGHAYVGHMHDWISYDPARSEGATLRTLDALVTFRADVLGQDGPTPDLGRIRAVLQRMIDVNPRDAMGIESFGGEMSPEAWWDSLATPTAAGLTGVDAIDSGLPDYYAAHDVIEQAIREDRLADRLEPGWDHVTWASPPIDWLRFDYDEDGRVVSRDGSLGSTSLAAAEAGAAAYAVEQPEVRVVGAPTASVTLDEALGGLFRIHVSGSYEVSGVVSALGPLPVEETCGWSDGVARPVWPDRPDGRVTLAAEVFRTAEALQAGLSWQCVVRGYGTESVTWSVPVPAVDIPEPDAPAATGVDPDLASRLAVVLGARAAAAAAHATVESTCTAATGQLDAVEAAVVQRETDLGHAAAALDALEVITPELRVARAAATRVVDETWAEARSCATDRDAMIADVERACDGGDDSALRSAEIGRDRLIRCAERVRQSAARIRVPLDRLKASLGQLDAVGTFSAVGLQDAATAAMGLVEAAEASRRTMRHEPNKARGAAAQARADWRRITPNTDENRDAMGALIAAWSELDARSGQGGCVDGLRSRGEILVRRAASGDVGARLTAARLAGLRDALPDARTIRALEEAARDADSVADATEIFIPDAVIEVERAAACVDGTASDPETLDELPPPSLVDDPDEPEDVDVSGSGTQEWCELRTHGIFGVPLEGPPECWCHRWNDDTMQVEAHLATRASCE